jgi:hypothetical protein
VLSLWLIFGMQEALEEIELELALEVFLLPMLQLFGIQAPRVHHFKLIITRI